MHFLRFLIFIDLHLYFFICSPNCKSFIWRRAFCISLFPCGGAEAMKTQNNPPGAHSVTKKERVAPPLRPSATL